MPRSNLTSVAPSGPALPRARGPLSAAVLGALVRPPGAVALPPVDVTDAVADDDLQLALYVCYELHYLGFAGVDPDWEWSPALLAARRDLEARFLTDLVRAVGPDEGTGATGERLVAAIAGHEGRSLSAYVAEHATLQQVAELCAHRSPYQLKEADPHTWAIPRLVGEAKAAMVDIQTDEYGRGDPAEMHATLFARTMAEVGLDPAYGAHLDALPGITLATVNLISLFGLHRRWRAAAVGHLAVFEMTSVVPMGRYAAALERLGFGTPARRFYDVHVEADAQHQVIALERMVRPLVAAEPALAPDVVFGARAVLHVEGRFTEHVLGAWDRGRSSLLGGARALAGVTEPVSA